jgi:hypothetical protein
MNFITRHLIDKIGEQLRLKQATLKHDHFYYFDEPIKDGKNHKRIIDRVNRSYPFVKEEILPITWYALDGTSLMEVYLKLKHNKFYVYKKLEDGKSYKTRIKNK